MSNLNLKKILFGVFIALVAAVLGYFAVYAWTITDAGKWLPFGALRSQVVATQRADDIKDQLKSLGYEFEEGGFYPLTSPDAVRYRADVLGGFEPTKIEDEPRAEEGYYFYDQSGTAYYFSVGADNTIDPEKIVPLITE